MSQVAAMRWLKKLGVQYTIRFIPSALRLRKNFQRNLVYHLIRCDRIRSHRLYRVSKYNKNWHAKFLYAISVQLLGLHDFTYLQIYFLNEKINFKYLKSNFYVFERKLFGGLVYSENTETFILEIYL